MIPGLVEALITWGELHDHHLVLTTVDAESALDIWTESGGPLCRFEASLIPDNDPEDVDALSINSTDETLLGALQYLAQQTLESE